MSVFDRVRDARREYAATYDRMPCRLLLSTDVEKEAIAEERARLYVPGEAFEMVVVKIAHGEVVVRNDLPPGTIRWDEGEEHAQADGHS